MNGLDLRGNAATEIAAFVRRWPDRPEAVAAGRMWNSLNVTQEFRVTDDESFRQYIDAVLPAYYADYRKTAERHGTDLALRVTYDPNRLPASWDVRDWLSAISVPALVIVGSHDFICSPRFAYGIYAGIPGSQLCELRESGHFGHIEEPHEFADTVLDFVDAQERRSA